ncbi:MAG: GDSL-type esterase/lipase family protein [Bryobacterales bacterium]|nr:GDSL-type esterase/lipase family protein [Bryobacterales bacterium]
MRMNLYAAALAIFTLWAGLVAGQKVHAQASSPAPSPEAAAPAWNANEMLAAYDRSAQLIESTAILIPNLSRAGEPLLEQARQSVLNLNANGESQNVVQIHRLNAAIRAYLQLLDAMEKPYPLPETTQKQVAELRQLFLELDAWEMELLRRNQSAIRGSDRDNFARYREANAKLSAPNAKVPRVVFLGDSITDGWRLDEYFPGYDFVNRGISGQITGQMLGRFQHDVIALRPSALVILAGTNDIGRGVPSEVIESNLESIFDLADKYRIKVVVGTVMPVSDYAKDRGTRYIQTERRSPSRIAALNIWLKQEASRRRYKLVDYHAAMADNTGALRKEFSDDGLHPNAAGYRAIAPLAMAAIRDVVKLPGR